MAVLIGLLAFAMGAPSSRPPAPRREPSASAKAERSPARLEAHPRPLPERRPAFAPRPMYDKPAETVLPPLAPATSRESVAQEAYYELEKFARQASEGKAGKLAAVEAFLKKYGDTVAAARAQLLADQLKGPEAPRTQEPPNPQGRPKAQEPAKPKTPPKAQEPAKVLADLVSLFKHAQEREAAGDLNTALDDYTQALQRAPNSAEAYSNRAQVKWRMGDLEGALADSDRAIGLSPELWQTYANRAIALLGLGREEEAQESLEKLRALHSAPPAIESTVNQSGKLARQIRLGRGLEGKDPATAEEFLWRGEYRLTAKRFEEAGKDLEEGLKRDPTLANKGIYLLLALVAQEKKDWKGKLECYRRWAQAVPKMPEALNSLAWELLTSAEETLRDPKASLALAQKAAELSQFRNAGILDTLALAYFRTGQVQDALVTQRTAVDLLPANFPPAQRKVFQDHLKEYEMAQPHASP